MHRGRKTAITSPPKKDFQILTTASVGSTALDYALPVGKGQKFLNQGGVTNAIFGGWHVGGIITFRSGFPFRQCWATIRPTPVPRAYFGPIASATAACQIQALACGSTLMISLPLTCYCFGNAGKNILEGPGEKSADLSARKFFSITEQVRLEFRAEFFNAFNHAVFAQPDNYITDGPGAAGVITSTVIPQRQTQFALKLEF